MVRIERVETLHIALPPRRVHKWRGLTETIGGYVLVRVTGDNGLVGWGEAPVVKDWGGDFGRYFGETPGTTKYVIENHLAPAVVDAEAGNFASLHSRMNAAIKGYPYAKASVEMAAYDLFGRSLKVPVYSLLGGCVRKSVLVTHSIGLLPIDEALAECVQVVNEGIRTIKIKVGAEPARDIEIVQGVREAVGQDVELCVDANQGYLSPREAIKTIKAMETYGLKYVEQPVEGIRRMAEVASAVDTPVMADESAWSAQDVLEIIERRAADIISIYTTKPGGLYRAMEVAAVAHAAGLPCNVNGSVETGVGNLANIQLAVAAPCVTLPCVVPVSTPVEAQHGQLAGIYYKDDLIKAPLEFSNGAIKVPDGPGMGIEVDEEKIARYRVDRHE
jgi:muconate cycloisomerase